MESFKKNFSTELGMSNACYYNLNKFTNTFSLDQSDPPDYARYPD